MKLLNIVCGLISIGLLTLVGCKSDPVSEDSVIYSEVINTTGHKYFKSGNVLSPASNSPHGNFRLRFNPKAQSVFDANGNLPKGVSYPNGSLVVKEIVDGSNKVNLYAIMKKDSTSPYAVKGWLWSEYGTSGGVDYSISNKGSSCVSCHSQTPNRDYTISWDVH
jgi:hypothetical protein